MAKAGKTVAKNVTTKLYSTQNVVPRSTTLKGQYDSDIFFETPDSSNDDQEKQLLGIDCTSYQPEEVINMPAVSNVNSIPQQNFTPLSSVTTLLSPNSMIQNWQQEEVDINSDFCGVLDNDNETQSDVESDSESDETEDDEPIDSVPNDLICNKANSGSQFTDPSAAEQLNLLQFSTFSSNSIWNWETSASSENLALYAVPTTSQIGVQDSKLFPPLFIPSNVCYFLA